MANIFIPPTQDSQAVIQSKVDSSKSPSNGNTHPAFINREAYLVDTVTLEKLRFQFIPLELDYQPKSTWAVIPSIGRNNPFYHYTGSEDTLNFTLDWNAAVDSREDVIRSCKWVEALSKANGYSEEPHPVLLIWGQMASSLWIVENAPYKMELFNPSRKLLPTQAYQEVTLKRITPNNRVYSEIKALSI